MNKYLIIITLSFAFSCKRNIKADVYTAKEIPSLTNTDIRLSIINDTIFYNRAKYTGTIYQLYPENIDTLSIKNYSDGVLNGISKIFYENHQIMEYREYHNGAKHGKQIAYWQNGNKKFEFTAYEDAYEGELKEWLANGALFHIAHYKNGQEDGEQKMWYDNGKIKANYIIKNGKRYGLLGTKNCINVSDSIFIDK